MLVHLPSGVDVVIRHIRPDDKAMLADGLANLSSESAYRRFLAPKSELTLRELRYLTEVDFQDHVAVVAVRREDPATLAGVARWIRSPNDARTAEMAFLVADELQGQGLGTALAAVLADEARRRGVHRITATTLPTNIAARRLLAGISERVEITVNSGVYHLRGELAA